jgi:hypothetical protein
MVYTVRFSHSSPPRCQIGGNDDVRRDRLTVFCLGAWAQIRARPVSNEHKHKESTTLDMCITEQESLMESRDQNAGIRRLRISSPDHSVGARNFPSNTGKE